MTLKLLEEFDEYVPPGEAVAKTHFNVEFLDSLTINRGNVWLVRDVLPRHGVAAIYGPSGCGKSFWLTDVSLRIAAAIPVADHGVKQGGVIYVATEGTGSFDKRVIAAQERLALKPDIPFALIKAVPDLGSKATDLEPLMLAIEAAKQARHFDVHLVCIDTLGQAIAGESDSGSDVAGAFVKNCKAIADRFGCLTAFIHHTGKDTANGPRGSNVFTANTDTVILIERNDDGGSRAIIHKQRDGESDLESSFRLERVELGVDDEGFPMSTCVISELKSFAPRERKPSRTGPSIPASLRLFMDVFTETIADVGKMSRPFPDGPEVRTVDRETLRTAFYEKRGDDSQKAKNQAFNRGLNQAMSTKIILAKEAAEGVILWRP